MLRIFAKVESCYIIFMSSTQSAVDIELLKQGKFDHLYIQAPNAREPNAYFSTQFQLFASLQEAQTKLQHKDLQRTYILEMKNGIEKTQLLAAQGKFSEGIHSVIEPSASLDSKVIIKDVTTSKRKIRF